MQTVCLDVSRLQNHQNQKLMNLLNFFVYDVSRYCFDLSCVIALFLVKDVFLCFNSISVIYRTCLDLFLGKLKYPVNEVKSEEV